MSFLNFSQEAFNGAVANALSSPEVSGILRNLMSGLSLNENTTQTKITDYMQTSKTEQIKVNGEVIAHRKYTARSGVFSGDGTNEIKDLLKENGAKWNNNLKNHNIKNGWVCTNKIFEQILKVLDENEIVYVIEDYSNDKKETSKAKSEKSEVKEESQKKDNVDTLREKLQALEETDEVVDVKTDITEGLDDIEPQSASKGAKKKVLPPPKNKKIKEELYVPVYEEIGEDEDGNSLFTCSKNYLYSKNDNEYVCVGKYINDEMEELDNNDISFLDKNNISH